MLSVKTPSFAEFVGKVRPELTRGFLLNILRLKKSWPKATWPNSNPIFRMAENFETLFLLCTLSIFCYTGTYYISEASSASVLGHKPVWWTPWT
jgi:hypothetical protein